MGNGLRPKFWSRAADDAELDTRLRMRECGPIAPVEAPDGHPNPAATVIRMTTLIIVLLVLWAVFAVVGFVVEGLLWLAFIGLILLAATAVWGWITRRTARD